MWIPVCHSWLLNECHYGALQGLNKAETAAKYGEAQVKLWRRSYGTRPPELTEEDPRWPGREPRYRAVSPQDLPLAECLKDTVGPGFCPIGTMRFLRQATRGRGDHCCSWQQPASRRRILGEHLRAAIRMWAGNQSPLSPIAGETAPKHMLVDVTRL